MSTFYPGVEFGFRKVMYPDLGTKKWSLIPLATCSFLL